MNCIGIFSKTFPRPTFEAVLDAIAAHGIPCIQFNFASTNVPPLPAMRDALSARKMTVAAVSGTFNLIDPDVHRRRENVRRLRPIAEGSTSLAAPVVTLCTGTRDPDDMWRAHPENTTAAAWQDLIESITGALALTEPSGVTLAIEPEPGNVISTARRARALLDAVRHPRLRIAIDAANLLAAYPDADQRTVLAEAFDLLGGDIVLVHAKELLDRIPGRGRLDWDLYFRLLAGIGYTGPVILHGFIEEDTAEAMRFVRSRLNR